MAKVTITQTGDKFQPLLIEYECTCGTSIKLYTDTKPKRLTKCWNCAQPDAELFKLTKSGKYTEKPKFKKDVHRQGLLY